MKKQSWFPCQQERRKLFSTPERTRSKLLYLHSDLIPFLQRRHSFPKLPVCQTSLMRFPRLPVCPTSLMSFLCHEIENLVQASHLNCRCEQQPEYVCPSQ